MWACALGGILGCVQKLVLHRDGVSDTLIAVGVFVMMSAGGFSYLLAKKLWTIQLSDIFALMAFVAVTLAVARLNEYLFAAVALLTVVFCLWKGNAT